MRNISIFVISLLLLATSTTSSVAQSICSETLNRLPQCYPEISDLLRHGHPLSTSCCYDVVNVAHFCDAWYRPRDFWFNAAQYHCTTRSHHPPPPPSPKTPPSPKAPPPPPSPKAPTPQPSPKAPPTPPSPKAPPPQPSPKAPPSPAVCPVCPVCPTPAPEPAPLSPPPAPEPAPGSPPPAPEPASEPACQDSIKRFGSCAGDFAEYQIYKEAITPSCCDVVFDIIKTCDHEDWPAVSWFIAYTDRCINRGD